MLWAYICVIWSISSVARRVVLSLDLPEAADVEKIKNIN